VSEEEKKKERETVEREREGGSMQFESAESCSLLSLSHRKTLVWRRHWGVFFTPVLHMSFTHSFKQYSLPLDCISDPKTMKRQILHASLLVCWIPWLSTHTAQGHSFFIFSPVYFYFLLSSNRFSSVVDSLWFVPDKRILVGMH